MSRFLRILPLTLLLSSAAWAAPPPLSAESAKTFAKAIGAQLSLKAQGSRLREEAYTYPNYRAVSARFEGLTVNRVWLASHAEALSFVNARRIALTADGKRDTLFNVLEVRGEQALVTSGARLQDAAFLHRVRRAAWLAMPGDAPRAIVAPIDLGVKYLPAKPALILYRVRIARPAEQYLLELPAAQNRVSIPDVPSGPLVVEPAIGASPAGVDWGASRAVEVNAEEPLVIIGEGYEVGTRSGSASSKTTGEAQTSKEQRPGLTGALND